MTSCSLLTSYVVLARTSYDPKDALFRLYIHYVGGPDLYKVNSILTNKDQYSFNIEQHYFSDSQGTIEHTLTFPAYKYNAVLNNVGYQCFQKAVTLFLTQSFKYHSSTSKQFCFFAQCLYFRPRVAAILGVDKTNAG
jgi:hypothetical protein